MIEQVAGMTALVGRSVRALVTPPFSWFREFVEQASLVVSRVALPLALSVAFFISGTGTIIVLGVLEKIGAEDRYGFGVLTAGLREFNGWITAMCVAGIAGTAICSDLGARKVRDELDAMSVLGVDPYRLLVLPRVLALTLMTPLLYLWSTFVVVLVGGGTGAAVAGYPLSSFAASAETFVELDLVVGLAKMTLIGFFVAVVCCFKGMNASGGPEGVGRGVNQAVVIAFAAAWIVNYLFNALVLAGFPSLGDLR